MSSLVTDIRPYQTIKTTAKQQDEEGLSWEMSMGRDMEDWILSGIEEQPGTSTKARLGKIQPSRTLRFSQSATAIIPSKATFKIKSVQSIR